MMSFNYGGVSRVPAEIGTMGYGTTLNIPRHRWEEIVPRPDPLRQLILAASGHRPETEREPDEWFRFWLNGTEDDDFMKMKNAPFRVDLDTLSGDMIIHLPDSECPKCKGRGFYMERQKLDLDLYAPISDASETVEIITSKCSHERLREK